MVVENSGNEALNEIKQTLQTQLALFKLVHANEIQSAIEKRLGGETKRRVYDLCDGATSVSEIAIKVGISQPTATSHLNDLCMVGLVDYKTIAGKRCYYKTLE
jgi:predicted transcriptional regulator